MKTSKLRVTGLCERNSPLTGELSAQMASYAEIFLFDDVIMLMDKEVQCITILVHHFLTYNMP